MYPCIQIELNLISNQNLMIKLVWNWNHTNLIIRFEVPSSCMSVWKENIQEKPFLCLILYSTVKVYIKPICQAGGAKIFSCFCQTHLATFFLGRFHFILILRTLFLSVWNENIKEILFLNHFSMVDTVPSPCQTNMSNRRGTNCRAGWGHSSRRLDARLLSFAAFELLLSQGKVFIQLLS